MTVKSFLTTLSISLLIACAMQTFLLFEANKVMDSQYFYMKTEVYAAYRYACTEDLTKTIIECGMEADDYIEEYLKE